MRPDPIDSEAPCGRLSSDELGRRLGALDERIGQLRRAADRLQESAERRSARAAELQSQPVGAPDDRWSAEASAAEDALMSRFFAADVEPEPSQKWLLETWGR